MATWYEMVIPRGTSLDRTWDYLNDDETPIDVSGWNAELRIARRFTETAVVTITETPNARGSKLVLGNGTVRLYIAEQETLELALSGNLYHFTLWLNSPTGADECDMDFLRGPLLIPENVKQ